MESDISSKYAGQFFKKLFNPSKIVKLTDISEEMMVLFQWKLENVRY